MPGTIKSVQEPMVGELTGPSGGEKTYHEFNSSAK